MAAPLWEGGLNFAEGFSEGVKILSRERDNAVLDGADVVKVGGQFGRF